MIPVLAFTAFFGSCDPNNVTIGLKIESEAAQATAREVSVNLKAFNIDHPFDAIWVAGIRWDPAALKLVDVELPPEIPENPAFFYFLGPPEDGGDPENPGTAGIDSSRPTFVDVLYEPEDGEVVMGILRFEVLRPVDSFVEVLVETPEDELGRTFPTAVFVCGETRLFEPGDGRELRPGQVTFESPFIRGDADGGGLIELADAIVILVTLFLGDQRVICPRAADVDDSGNLNLTDPIRILNYLFRAGPPPVAPFPDSGFDQTGRGC
jgi:hypothetical protein